MQLLIKSGYYIVPIPSIALLLGEEAEIDDELYQKIYDNMLERLKDKGQLISKCPFGPSNLQKKTKENFALASKKELTKKRQSIVKKIFD